MLPTDTNDNSSNNEKLLKRTQPSDDSEQDYPDFFGEGSSFGRYRAFLHRMNSYLDRLTHEYTRIIKKKKVEPDQYAACILANDNNLVYLTRQMYEFFDVIKHSCSMFDKLHVLDQTINEACSSRSPSDLRRGWSAYTKAIRERTEMLHNVLHNNESLETLEEMIDDFHREHFASEIKLVTDGAKKATRRKRRKLERVHFSQILEEYSDSDIDVGQPPAVDEDNLEYSRFKHKNAKLPKPQESNEAGRNGNNLTCDTTIYGQIVDDQDNSS